MKPAEWSISDTQKQKQKTVYADGRAARFEKAKLPTRNSTEMSSYQQVKKAAELEISRKKENELNFERAKERKRKKELNKARKAELLLKQAQAELEVQREKERGLVKSREAKG